MTYTNVISDNMRFLMSKFSSTSNFVYQHPLLAMRTKVLGQQYLRFCDAMPGVRPHYAVKANPHSRVVEELNSLGCGFEVASMAEVKLLFDLNIAMEHVLFSNPVKSAEAISYASSIGMEWFSFDCQQELEKIVSINRRAKLMLRLDVPNHGSEWPLSGKFGANLAEVDSLCKLALKKNANLRGITFHVGSQCRNTGNWGEAIEYSRIVIQEMKQYGFDVELLNIGGGYPVEMTTPVPSIEKIGLAIKESLSSIPSKVSILAEPGRFLVANAGCLICQVIGLSRRDGARWAYLDVGMFGGLFEHSQGLSYVICSQDSKDLVPWKLAGPTCDAVDVMPSEQLLPSALTEGDLVFILNAGAYTSVYASGFNGFSPPVVTFF